MTSGGNSFNDFPENQLPKFQQIGMAPPYQISDTASGATGFSTAASICVTGDGDEEHAVHCVRVRSERRDVR